MKIIDQANASASLAEYASEVGNLPIIVTSDGKPVAALVRIENADLETISLSTNAQFLGLIQQSRESVQSAEPVSSDEMRRRFE
jgi:antitoxin (DNA-binding transcriptional repressor) of toxin-antitoxin stability system